MARTKIVATIGPASKDKKTIRKLINLGVDVFRLNFSHGTKEEHAEYIRKIREISGDEPIMILGDLCGPKLRCGEITGGQVVLKPGKEFVLTTRKISGSVKEVSINYKQLPQDVTPGETIFLDDGNIEMEVIQTGNTDVRCRILSGGPLSSHKGINLPTTDLSIPALTRYDREMVRFGVKHEVDCFALSFVKNAKDMQKCKRAVIEAGGDIPVIAKIEKHEAVKNLEDIINEADGAMVARGDLGIEIPLQDVPFAQKKIIRMCNEKGKPVITATQMLESMIGKSRPTRAEVADIANAIIDGTDAVMLSGETAVGNYPTGAVHIMDTVAKSTEKNLDYNAVLSERALAEAGSVPDAISLATSHIARSLDVDAILCCSASGYTARFVARYRPVCPILVFTLDRKIQRRLNLTWGVIPFLMDKIDETGDFHGFDAVMTRALEIAKKNRYIKKGHNAVVTAGLPLGIGGTTNMLRVIKVE